MNVLKELSPEQLKALSPEKLEVICKAMNFKNEFDSHMGVLRHFFEYPRDSSNKIKQIFDSHNNVHDVGTLLSKYNNINFYIVFDYEYQHGWGDPKAKDIKLYTEKELGPKLSFADADLRKICFPSKYDFNLYSDLRMRTILKDFIDKLDYKQYLNTFSHKNLFFVHPVLLHCANLFLQGDALKVFC